MAIVAQKRLFDWHEIVLDYLPDEKLMRSLERRRGNGRNDYPLRAGWCISIPASRAYDGNCRGITATLAMRFCRRCSSGVGLQYLNRGFAYP